MKTPRRIVFKAKRKDNNEWIIGDLTHRKSRNCVIKPMFSSINSPSYNIDPATLSQFTGMYDKNRKRIFENDIVKTQYGRLCVVKWYSSDSYCGWDLDPINTNDNLELKPPSEYFLYNEECNEIVGNVFDNYVL